MENLLRKALNIILASDEDQATQQNGVGFNGSDTGFAHNVATKEFWSAKQIECVKRMLRKYKRQIPTDLYDSIYHNKQNVESTKIETTPIQQVKKIIKVTVAKSLKLNAQESCFISFPYDNKILQIMRNQAQRFWHAETKEWEIPSTKFCKVRKELENLQGYEIKMMGTISELIEGEKVVALPDTFKFKTKPFDHQMRGLEYGLKYDKWLLGDEQGLGKTKQVIDIAVAKKAQGNKHCLIICGVNGLKWNWCNEVCTHSDESSHILGTRYRKNGTAIIGSSKDKLEDLNNLPQSYFLITNVETLRDEAICKKLQELIASKEIDMIAIDEIHKCKNPQSQQGKAILKLQPTIRIAMSGTPLMNTPLDLYVVLKWLGYETHAFNQFKNHYCVFGGYGGYEIVSYKNLNQLQEQTDDIMLRRLKKDVLDLPEKVYINEYVEMNTKQAKVYKEVYQEVKEQIDTMKIGDNPLEQLIRLRQATGYTGILSSSIKESAKLERLEELLEDITSNGHKAIIFTNWTSMVHPVIKRFSKYNPACITGEIKDRVAEQDKFMQDDNCKIIVGTIGAMGTGLTLTKGTYVIFLDEPWNRANKEQAEDRAHRIGTTETVTIITLVTKNTIDEKINELVYKKGDMADALIDGKVNTSRRATLEFLLN